MTQNYCKDGGRGKGQPTEGAQQEAPPPDQTYFEACDCMACTLHLALGPTMHIERGPLLRLCTFAVSVVWAGWHPHEVTPSKTRDSVPLQK
jgi:hypothetical protein